MTSAVHILWSGDVEQAAAKLAALRVGFPTAPVQVWGNGLTAAQAKPVEYAARGISANFVNLLATNHDAWVESLVMNQSRPVWLVSPEVTFNSAVEWFYDDADTELFAGRLVPSHGDEATGWVHVERLNPALMWINCPAVRGEMLRWMRTLPERPNLGLANISVPFLRQHLAPARPFNIFYGTTAGLWQAGWGKAFIPKQNAAFNL